MPGRNGEALSQPALARCGPVDMQRGESNRARYDMAADPGARLRRLHVRRSDHQHDRRRKRDDRQRIVRGDENTPCADRDAPPSPDRAATTLR